MLTVLGLLLALPYVFSRGLLPLLNVSGQLIQQCFIFGWLIEISAIALLHLGALIVGYAVRLHNSIRDERYLERRVLNNLEH